MSTHDPSSTRWNLAAVESSTSNPHGADRSEMQYTVLWTFKARSSSLTESSGCPFKRRTIAPLPSRRLSVPRRRTGPIDQFDNADAYQQAIRDLSQMKTDIAIRKTFVDGPDVVTWYDLHTKIAAPAAVAEWSHVEQGKITMVRVVFDARPFTAARPPQASSPTRA